MVWCSDEGNGFFVGELFVQRNKEKIADQETLCANAHVRSICTGKKRVVAVVVLEFNGECQKTG